MEALIHGARRCRLYGWDSYICLYLQLSWQQSSSFSIVLITRLFGDRTTYKWDETAANSRLLNSLFPLLMQWYWTSLTIRLCRFRMLLEWSWSLNLNWVRRMMMILDWNMMTVEPSVLLIVKSRQFAIKVIGGAEVVKQMNQSLLNGAKQDKSNDCFA